MVAAELLLLLLQHAGREYQAVLLPAPPPATPAKKQHAAPRLAHLQSASIPSHYFFTARGEQIEATGPSGQTRMLSAQRFGALFAGVTFGCVQPTGRLSDLGPLFAASPSTPPLFTHRPQED